jgi:hypothetical protein
VLCRGLGVVVVRLSKRAWRDPVLCCSLSDCCTYEQCSSTYSVVPSVVLVALHKKNEEEAPVQQRGEARRKNVAGYLAAMNKCSRAAPASNPHAPRVLLRSSGTTPTSHEGSYKKKGLKKTSDKIKREERTREKLIRYIIFDFL